MTRGELRAARAEPVVLELDERHLEETRALHA